MANKTKIGVVKSDRMQKTVSVEVCFMKKHPIYGRKYKVSKKFLAENGKNAKLGDQVIIEECRPISKNKSWSVKEII